MRIHWWLRFAILFLSKHKQKEKLGEKISSLFYNFINIILKNISITYDTNKDVNKTG